MRRRVVVHGRVQGVFFRETTRRLAEEAGVRGWVRNTWEGTVEAVFEGPPEAVERLVAPTRGAPMPDNDPGAAGPAPECQICPICAGLAALREARPEAVEHLVAFVNRGPGPARVERVEVFEEDEEGLTEFAVR